MQKPAKPAELDSLVARVKSRGAIYKPEVMTGFPLGIGCLFAALGTWMAVSSLTTILSVKLPEFLPKCAGNPYFGLTFGSICIAIGVVLCLVSHIKPDDIHLTDKELIVGFRNRKPVNIAWWEISEYIEVGTAVLVRLHSGRWRILPMMPVQTAWRIELIMSLAVLLSKHLSPEQMSLAKAYEMTKLDIVGPGVTFPIGKPQQRENLSRILLVLLPTSVFALLFAANAVVFDGKIIMVFLPIAIGAFICAAIFRRQRLYHTVTLGRKGLGIKLEGAELASLAIDDIKATKLSADGLAVNCHDKNKSIELRLDIRSARLAHRLIAVTKGFGGIGVATVGQSSNKTAAA